MHSDIGNNSWIEGTMCENVFLKKRICVWGCGKYANRFVKVLDAYYSLFENVFDANMHIDYFVDSNEEKWGGSFLSYKVEKPEYFFDKLKDNVCIIAIRDTQSVYSIMRTKGLVRRRDYYEWSEFIDEVNRFIIANIKRIISYYEKKEGTVFEDSNEIEDDISRGENRIVGILKKWSNIENYKMKKPETMKVEDYIAVLAFACGRDVIRLGQVLNTDCNVHDVEVKTIGLYYMRLYNGGVQKVIANLIPLYLDKGYRVVLFTDEYCPEKEYTLPKCVTRVVLQNSRDSINIANRLEEYRTYIEQYHIDIMCFHGNVMERTFAYELAFIKMCGVRVIVELHESFYSIVTSEDVPIKQMLSILHIANAIVVLSNINKVLWMGLELNTYYIQNPIKKMHTFIPKSFSKRKEILWVGRINDVDNCIYDIVPIMKSVKKNIEDAVLRVVGDGEEGTIKSLRRMIANNGLEENIIFEGYHTNVEDYYMKACVMLITINKGGFPTVFVEQKLYGIPAVIYDIPYIELLREKKGFIGVPIRDTEGAANSIISLLNADEEHLKKMSNDARESLKPFLNYDVANEWKKLFDEVSVGTSINQYA